MVGGGRHVQRETLKASGVSLGTFLPPGCQGRFLATAVESQNLENRNMETTDYRRHALAPKVPSRRKRTRFIPFLPERDLNWLFAKLAPRERQALRKIVSAADLIEVNGKQFLLAAVDHRTIDVLAEFEAEAEDRELELEDEKETDVEDDGPADKDAMELEMDGEDSVDTDYDYLIHDADQVANGKRMAWLDERRTRYDSRKDDLEGRRVQETVRELRRRRLGVSGNVVRLND